MSLRKQVDPTGDLKRRKDKVGRDLGELATDTVENIKDAVQRKVEDVKDSAAHAKEGARNTIEDVKAKAGAVKEDIKDGFNAIVDDIHKTADETRREVKKPL